MRSVAWWILSAGALALLLAVSRNGVFDGASAADSPKASTESQGAKPLPPLKVDKGAPLLLLRKASPKPTSDAGPQADNSACFCCHGNYREEVLATVHAKQNIGCVKCHGQSVAHRGDEANVTPPDKMYASDLIAPMCQECHQMHDAPAKKVIALWHERCAAKQKPEEILCTDCHGQHRLPSRTVVWDKKTGKLAPRDQVHRAK